jgi:hypothetical protein
MNFNKFLNYNFLSTHHLVLSFRLPIAIAYDVYRPRVSSYIYTLRSDLSKTSSTNASSAGCFERKQCSSLLGRGQEHPTKKPFLLNILAADLLAITPGVLHFHAKSMVSVKKNQ